MENKNFSCEFFRLSGRNPFKPAISAFVYERPGGDGPGGPHGMEADAHLPTGPAGTAGQPAENTAETHHRERIEAANRDRSNNAVSEERTAVATDEEIVTDEFRADNPKLMEYADFLERGVDFGNMVRLLRAHPEIQITRWSTTEYSTEAADFISKDEFPGDAEGKRAFTEALRIVNREGVALDPRWEYARAHLRVFVARVMEHMSVYERTTRERTDFREREGIGAYGGKVKVWGRNLMENFHQASGGEKLMMIAAGGVVLKLLWDLWKKMKGTGWDTAALFALAGVSLNYISGKVSDDKKTIFNRLGMNTRIEDLPKESVYTVFALFYGNTVDTRRLWKESLYFEEEREVSAISTFGEGNINIRDINRVWQRQNPHARQAFTVDELEDMGFAREKALSLVDNANQAQSTTAYRVVQKLYWLAALNYYPSLQEQEAKARTGGKTLSDTEKSAMRSWEQNSFSDLGVLAITQKYLAPGAPRATFQDIMVDETLTAGGNYPGGIEQLGRDLYSEYERAQPVARVAAAVERTGRQLLATGERWGRAVQAYSIAAYGRVRGWINQGMNRLKIHRDTNKLRDFFTDILQGTDFELREADRNGTGKVWMFGVPLLYSDRQLDSDGKVTSVKIEGVELLTASDSSARSGKIDEIKAKAKTKLENTIKASTLAGVQTLDLTKLEWDGAEKKWVIKDGKRISAHQRLGITARAIDIDVKISEAEEVEFYFENGRIYDFDNINASFRRTHVENEIYNKFPELKNSVVTNRPRTGASPTPVVPVEISDVRENSTTQEITIRGKIGGIDVNINMLPNMSLAQALDTVLDPIPMTEAFILNYVRDIAQDRDFIEPFMALSDIFQNASEGGITQRVRSAWDTTTGWGVIPTNLRGLFIGNIMETRADHMLGYKMSELLHLIGRTMEGKTLNDLDTAMTQAHNIYTNGINEIKHVKSNVDHDIANPTQSYSRDEMVAKNFSVYYENILNLNYKSPEYKDKVKKLIDAVSRPEFNYLFDGIEGIDSPHRIFTRILMVFLHRTASYSQMNSADIRAANAGTTMDSVINEIVTNLRRVQTRASTANQMHIRDMRNDPFFRMPAQLGFHTVTTN